MDKSVCVCECVRVCVCVCFSGYSKLSYLLCPSIQNKSNCTLATKHKMQRETAGQKEQNKRRDGRISQERQTNRGSVKRSGEAQKERGSPAAH